MSSQSAMHWILGAVAIAGLSWGLAVDPQAVWSGVLVAGLTGFYVAVGSGLFAAICIVCGARWWRGLEPVAGSVMRTVVVPAVFLTLVFVFGLKEVYPWALPGAAESSHLLHEKAGWLNQPFFLGRAFLLLILFTAWSRILLDEHGSGTVRTSAAFIIMGGLGVSVASWDWAMSIEPEWFSTMYGVYGFSTAILGGIAAITMVALRAERWGWVAIAVSPSQHHDLGKLLFGFSFFWAYIWFCQYMLIWYANVPEETGHYLARTHGGWIVLFWLNPIISFVIPFASLLSAHAKRHPEWLFQVSVLVLVGRWFDVLMMVAPTGGKNPDLPWASLLAAMLLVVWVGWSLRRSFAGDPRDTQLAGANELIARM